MKNNLSRQISTLPRYGGIMISIAVFIFLISSVLILNYYSSEKLARNAAEINASGQLIEMAQTITRDLFDLKLSWGEDPNSPHMQATLQRLSGNSKRFEQNLTAFIKGGVAIDTHGHATTLSALSNSDDRRSIFLTQNEWKILNVTIQEYLSASQDLSADSTNLDLAVDQAQRSNKAIYDRLSGVSANIAERAERQAGLLKILQITGISASILYFIIFVFYFIRKLRVADEKAEDARRETEEIMATVNEGLFLVDKNLTIGNQYSNELENIIGQKNIGGKKLSEILEIMISPDEIEITRSFIKQLFNKRTKSKLINDLNPLSRIKVEVDDLNGYHVSRYLDFKFSRVYQADEIERILVSVSDITSAINLENKLAKEHEQNDRQLEMLATILNTDGVLLQSFYGTVSNCIATVNNTLKDPGKGAPYLYNKLRDIYREIHSMKGEASALKLHGFVIIADLFEEKLKQLQNMSPITGNDFLSLTVLLDELINLFNTIEKLGKRIGIFGGEHAPSSVPMDQTQNAQVMQNYYENFVMDMANRNGKQVQLVCRYMSASVIPPKIATALKEVSIQLLRNAITHGIEIPEERERNNKSPIGRVKLLLNQEDNQSIALVVEDDGAGIDFESIRRKAVKIGYYTEIESQDLNRKQLLSLVFSSGFSTSLTLNEDAGRGVGMDVVKDRIKSINANLRISSVSGQYTRFTIKVPLTLKA